MTEDASPMVVEPVVSEPLKTGGHSEVMLFNRWTYDDVQQPLRIDAALEAMRVMGFAAKSVRKCVAKLLKVYGNEGWFFIEESSYKLLIETLLEGDGEFGPLPAITGGDGASSSAAAIGAGESSSLPLLCDREDDGVHKQDGSQDDSEQAPHELPQLESSAPAKKIRKPCYGWISDDDDSDDDDNFVSPPPANEDD